MAIDTKELALRLRQAREIKGLTQQQAAAALGLPRTAVAHLEAGKRGVSTLELARAAELYGRSVAWFFAGGPAEADDLMTLLHRADPSFAGAGESPPSLETVLDLFREGARLGRILGYESRAPLPIYDLPPLRSVGQAIEAGTRMAEEERRRLSLGGAPVAAVHELIAAQGVWTSEAELPPGVSGVCFHHPSVGVAVVANRAHGLRRRRFSFAHEFAHALLDRHEPVTVTSTRNESLLVEMRANVFAAAFLMPAEGVLSHLRSAGLGLASRTEHSVFGAASGSATAKEVREPSVRLIGVRDVVFLAIHFGVSYEAATHRLKSLGRLTKAESEHLLAKRDPGAVWLRTLAPDPPESARSAVSSELSQQIMRLALRTYATEGGISRAKLAELTRKLGLPVDEMLALAESERNA